MTTPTTQQKNGGAALFPTHHTLHTESTLRIYLVYYHTYYMITHYTDPTKFEARIRFGKNSHLILGTIKSRRPAE